MDQVGYPERDILRLVGLWEVQHTDVLCLSPARLPGPRWHRGGAGRGGGGNPARGTMRHPLPARNLSSPLGVGSGSQRSGGPEVEAVGEVGGVRDAVRAAVCGLRVVTSIPLSGPGAAVLGWIVRSGSDTNAARTGRPWLGPWPPARASTSRTPRSTYGTSSSWTGPRGVSQDSGIGPSQNKQRGGSGQGLSQVPQVPPDRLCILPAGEGRRGSER